jgi:mono/diheme cytochrome c family protein
MAEQPRYNPLAPSAFFEDGRSARPLVPGTVAWGKEYLRDDSHFYSGIRPPGPDKKAQKEGQGKGAVLGVGATALYELPDYFDTLPYPEKELPAMLRRGRERFDIFCSECHGRAGDGDGMIVRRGFTRPPNFATDESRGFKLRGVKKKLTEVPVGYMFDVVTNGFGAMPDYAAQVPPRDRWAIITYVRALQLSQNAPPDLLDEQTRRLLQKEGGK